MGMGVSILTVVAILVLAMITFLRGTDRAVESHRQAKWLVWTALALMGLYAFVWLVFGIAEVISGDFSGIIHLVPAIMLIVLMFLAWKRPLEGGIVFAVLGILASLYFGVSTMQGGRAFQVTSLIGGVPYLVFGLLCLIAVAMTQKRL